MRMVKVKGKGKERIQWWGRGFPKCDLCIVPIEDKFVDGKTKRGGPWALMCPWCHEIAGVGLGVGRGQLYHKAENGKFFKVN